MVFKKEHKPFGRATKGHINSELTRKKISKSNKGKSSWNKGTKGKMKAWNKGLTKFEKKECIICNKIFQPKSKKVQCCSWNCRNKLISKKNKGRIFTDDWKLKIKQNHPDLSMEKNPNWKGGLSFEVYPKEFNKELKKLIIKRDKNKCIFCNSIKKLAVHHIDYNKKNCSPDNLITLCNSCHGKTIHNRSYYRFLFQTKKKREYLLTTSQLIDRLNIVTLKSIKLKDKNEYKKESKMIINDLNSIDNKNNIKNEIGEFISAIQVNAIANLLIWENESSVRNGEKNMTKEEIADKLQLTHALNRVRNQSMNIISNIVGERKDLKLDYMDAELTKQFGYDFGGVL